MAHVGADERGLRAEAAELGLERLAFGLAAAGNDDGRALFGEGEAVARPMPVSAPVMRTTGLDMANLLKLGTATRSLPVGMVQKPASRCCWKLFGARLALLKKTL